MDQSSKATTDDDNQCGNCEEKSKQSVTSLTTSTEQMVKVYSKNIS